MLWCLIYNWPWFLTEQVTHVYLYGHQIALCWQIYLNMESLPSPFFCSFFPVLSSGGDIFHFPKQVSINILVEQSDLFLLSSRDVVISTITLLHLMGAPAASAAVRTCSKGPRIWPYFLSKTNSIYWLTARKVSVTLRDVEWSHKKEHKAPAHVGTGAVSQHLLACYGVRIESQSASSTFLQEYT